MLAGIAAQSVAPPGHMQIFACDSTSPNQVFDYTSNGTLRGRLTGLCITATTGGAGESPLWPAPCVDGDPSQVFLIEGNGHIRLENRTTCDYQPCAAGTCCECFDVLGGGVASGTELALYPCASPTAPNEAFTYDAQTGLLRGTESGLCADAGSRAPLPLLASYFQDHMVLQRGVPSPVWGFAPPAATVRVTLRGEVMGSASADANGTWRFVLPAMPASAVGANLTATRTDAGSNASLTIVNVLVGDVYVCSGQCEWGRGGMSAGDQRRIPRPLCCSKHAVYSAHGVECDGRDRGRRPLPVHPRHDGRAGHAELSAAERPGIHRAGVDPRDARLDRPRRLVRLLRRRVVLRPGRRQRPRARGGSPARPRV